MLKNWDKLKKASKGQETISDTFDSVPKILPALMRGQKIGKRASNAGVDFSETKQIIDLMRKQLDNLELAISTKNDSVIDDVFGDVLLSGCNLSRFIKKDSEKA